MKKERETWPGRCFTYRNDPGWLGGWEQLDWYVHKDKGQYATGMIGLTGIDKNDEYQMYSLPKKNNNFGGVFVEGIDDPDDVAFTDRALKFCNVFSKEDDTDGCAKHLREWKDVHIQLERNKNAKVVDEELKKEEKKVDAWYDDFMAMNYDDQNMGTSMAFLDLKGKGQEGDKGIILGAPTSSRKDLRGRVMIYGTNGRLGSSSFFDRSSNKEGKNFLWDFHLDSTKFKNGDQFGEQFGFSVTTGDFNNDGLTDIVVGAPSWYYKTESVFEIDRGRVYIFLQKSGLDDIIYNNGNKFSKEMAEYFEPAYSIEGEIEGAMFGHQVVCNGDLNDDGYDDLIVAAPFETVKDSKQQGRIYIFNGGDEKLGKHGIYTKTPSQTITHSQAKWYGLNIEFKSDIDKNGYNDVIVSTAESAEVFVYKTRPSIKLDINGDITPNVVHVESLSDREVDFKICAKYQTKANSKTSTLPGLIKVVLDTKASPKRISRKDGKTEFEVQFKGSKKLKLGIEQCKTLKLKINYQKGMNKVTPIMINSTLVVDTTTDLELKPIVDPFSKNSILTQLDLWKNCGEDNKCDTRFILKNPDIIDDDKEALYALAVNKPETVTVKRYLLQFI